VSTLHGPVAGQRLAPVPGWKNESCAPQETPLGLPQVQAEQLAAGAVKPVPPEKTLDVGDGQAGAEPAP
jgi:hypothetical protein